MPQEFSDERLYRWVHGTWNGEHIVACMLTMHPFVGVVVEFGHVQVDSSQNLDFDWRLIQVPSTVKIDQIENNIVFTKYLERIVIDRLSELTKDLENDNDQTNDTDGC